MVHRIRCLPRCRPGNRRESSSPLRSWGIGFAPGGAKHGRPDPGLSWRERREAREAFGFAALAEREESGGRSAPGRKPSASRARLLASSRPRAPPQNGERVCPIPTAPWLTAPDRAAPDGPMTRPAPVRARLRRERRDRPDPAPRLSLPARDLCGGGCARPAAARAASPATTNASGASLVQRTRCS